MNNPVKESTIKKIANSKGLDFFYYGVDNIYIMVDKFSREVLMTYAPITLALILSDKVWRQECNKLKTQVFR